MQELDIVVLDFETHWGKGYTLSGKEWNTSGYIRAPQFKAHGCGIKINDGKTIWISHKDLPKAFAAIDWKKSAVLAHNTAFDGAILAWVYGHVAAYYYDTLSMTRGLHNEVSRAKLAVIMELYQVGEKSKTYLNRTSGVKDLPPDIEAELAEGCIIDVDGCYDVFQKQMTVFPQKELDLIDLTLRMFIQPVLTVNKAVAEKALAEELQERTWLIASAGVPETTLTSNPKFAAALENLDVDPPMKISKTTGKGTYAFAQTDEEFLELLEHDNRQVVRLAAGRLAAKSTLFETRGRRLIDDGTNGLRLPVLLNYFGAKTGRWSGGNKCLIGETTIIIERKGQVMYSMLSSLKDSDRVWDGFEFVNHDGLVHQGLAKVMEYDGITGTANHQVWVEEVDHPTERLDIAATCGHTLRTGRIPKELEPITQGVPSSERSVCESKESELCSLWRTRPDFQIRYRQPHGRMGHNEFRTTSVVAT